MVLDFSAGFGLPPIISELGGSLLGPANADREAPNRFDVDTGGHEGAHGHEDMHGDGVDATSRHPSDRN